MKIIGYRRSDFVTKEGRPVTGCRIYLATEIASQNGEGVFVGICISLTLRWPNLKSTFMT